MESSRFIKSRQLGYQLTCSTAVWTNFAGLGEEDDVAGERAAGAVGLQHGLEVGGEGAIVVSGAAAVEDLAANLGGEGMDGPVGAIDGRTSSWASRRTLAGAVALQAVVPSVGGMGLGGTGLG